VKLLLDIGNSSVKWAYLSQGKLGDGGSIAHQGSIPVDAFSVWQQSIKPSQIVVANVAGSSMMHELEDWAHAQWGLGVDAPLAVAAACGVRNAYAQAEKLGIDRWAALLAARQRFADCPCCVIDCGTALTIDGLNADGQHLGGLIVPGLSMMRNALVGNTSGIQISGNQERVSASLLACNTEEAVERGTLNAMIATIKNTVKNLEATVKGDLACLLTGGDGRRLMPYLLNDFIYDDMLVLRGLGIISGELK